MTAAMSIVIIELYGSGVRISDGKNILANSVSCALIESDNTILVGELAEQQAHLRPRESSINFWTHLSENSDTKHVISNAEIAYHHLENIWNSTNYSDQEVILITPVTLDKHELGLLLGICKKLSINVAGIVCNATLAMQQPEKACKAVFLDLLQQQFAVTELIQNDVGISLKQPSRILDYGLQNFTQNCAKTIAKKFITETRFDPLHSSDDEQQFFDKLPLWLSTLSEKDSINCKLNAGEKHFTVQVNNEYLQKANSRLFEEIAAHLNVLFHYHSNVAIFCSSSCKQVFGFQEFLMCLPGCAIVQLEEINLAEHAIHCRDEIITGEQIRYINSLSWQDNSNSPSLDFTSGRLSNLSSIPTHILVNGHAYSLQQEIFIANSSVASEPRILLENSSDCHCKIFTNGLSVEVHVFDKQTIMLNSNLIETISTANIGDVLNIKGFKIDCQFIKVINNET